MIRDRLQEEKSEWRPNKWTKIRTPRWCSCLISAGLSMRTRRAWGSNAKPDGARGGSTQTGRPSSRPPRTPSLCLSLDRSEPLERVQASGPRR